MMNTVIIEDEMPAAERLAGMIKSCRQAVEILTTLDSIESAVDWFKQNPNPDLVFMDIQLADGLSFSIFPKCDIKSPVIFTTAFDQYTLNAFKVNSIDYLLKPIEQDELQFAMDKFESVHNYRPALQPEVIANLVKALESPTYKQRFLVKSGKELIYIPTKEVAYFYAEDGLTFLSSVQNRRYILDHTIEQIESLVDPGRFFRISRKCIVCLDAIHKIQPYFSGRLRLELKYDTTIEMNVSRNRVNDFKNWIDK